MTRIMCTLCTSVMKWNHFHFGHVYRHGTMHLLPSACTMHSTKGAYCVQYIVCSIWIHEQPTLRTTQTVTSPAIKCI